MKNRIYELLNTLQRDVIRNNGSDEIVYRIRNAHEQFHKNRISTIHAFCSDLLREHPVESGTDPGFSIIKGARHKGLVEQSIEMGVSGIWRNDKDLLMPLFQSFGSRGQIISSIHRIIEHPMTFERAMETSEKLFNTNDWEGLVFRDYCLLIKERYVIPYLEGLRNQEQDKPGHAELLDLLEKWHSHSKNDKAGFGIPDLFRDLRRLKDSRTPRSPALLIKRGGWKISYADLVDKFYPDLFYPVSPDSIFKKELNCFMRVAKTCLDIYEVEKRNLNVLDYADLETRAYRFLNRLSRKANQGQLKRIQDRFRHVMVDEFQDTNRIQWDIIRLLCTHFRVDGRCVLYAGKLFVVGDKRQAIYRFRGGDVTVFESVIREIKASNPDTPNPMFWQAGKSGHIISMISQGHADLVKKRTDQFESLPVPEKKSIMNGDVYLPHNFRTDPNPIDFINKAFNEIFGNKGASDLKVYETAPRNIKGPENIDASSQNKGSVTFYLTPALHRRESQVEAEAALVADILEGIMGKRGRDNHEYQVFHDIRDKIDNKLPAVGILFFTFNYLKTYENIFREAGLPFTVNRGKGFFRCQEVMEIIQLLHYLSDERQRISLLAVLRSPVMGLTDPEIFDLFYGRRVFSTGDFASSDNAYLRDIGRQIQSWRNLSCRLTIPELIRKIIHDRSLTAALSAHPNGHQRLANIEKLIEISRRFQFEGNGSLSEFVRYCLDMADEEEEEGEAMIISEEDSPITLMTIHSAKGLEFPMVIIPDLARNLVNNPGKGKPVRLYSDTGRKNSWNENEGEIPVWQVEIPALYYQKEYGPLGSLLMRRNLLENTAENRRVFLRRLHEGNESPYTYGRDEKRDAG